MVKRNFTFQICIYKVTIDTNGKKLICIISLQNHVCPNFWKIINLNLAPAPIAYTKPLILAVVLRTL